MIVTAGPAPDDRMLSASAPYAAYAKAFGELGARPSVARYWAALEAYAGFVEAFAPAHAGGLVEQAARDLARHLPAELRADVLEDVFGPGPRLAAVR